ncbi:tyrosine-type recombinase/integrase [Aureimonas ureilytica]|uniref:tyrosine-type recombinase/integrase n=1 Tax=Aureimonas ureilytica TaxID=401562 RepID=UPI003CF05655
MARNKLSERSIKAITKPGLYGDGDGLWLRAFSGGSKSWIFIYRRGSARTEMGLGGYGQGTAPVSLALAREKAEVIRQNLARGLDPRPSRNSKKNTFLDCVEKTIEIKAKTFTNPKHTAQWRSTLNTYATPIHDMEVAKITTDDIVALLEPIWEKIPETADRLRLRIASVLDYAKSHGLREGDNPAEWRGNLEHRLSSRQKLSRGHHAAVEYKDIPIVMAALRKASGVSARAVEFAALTAARTGEVRGATWDEIDREESVWIIPASRMKARREHRVPLSKRALQILNEMEKIATGPVIFNGEIEGQPVSNVAMAKALRRASKDNSTLHGLRSSFRDWAGDCTAHPREVIETALAHVVANKTEAAYRRSDALEKRRRLMSDWDVYLRGE